MLSSLKTKNKILLHVNTFEDVFILMFSHSYCFCYVLDIVWMATCDFVYTVNHKNGTFYFENNQAKC